MHRRGSHIWLRPSLLALVAAALVLAACGSGGNSNASKTAATPSTADASRDPVTLKLGYFPNITHASAIVGVEGGYFEKALGNDKLKTSIFNAGPAATEALLSGAI